MLPMLLSEIVSVSDAVMGVNYGAEKIRFTSPVPVGLARARCTRSC